MLNHETPFLGRFFSINGKPHPANPEGQEIKGNELVDAVASSNGEGAPINNREILIERWRRLPAKVDDYGMYPDGSRKQLLKIGGEQVMDTFEKPWCKETVEAMFSEMKNRGPLVVVERGFGLGIMSEFINNAMRDTGGTHIIIELNKDIAQEAKKWRDLRNREASRRLYAPQLRVEVEEGDADEKLTEMPDDSIDLLFSDTHQLQLSEVGINDLLQPRLLAAKLKPEGRFTFCAFHRNNQFGIVEDRQRELLEEGFNSIHIVDRVEVTPPPHCEYLVGPRRLLPVVVAYNPTVGSLGNKVLQ